MADISTWSPTDESNTAAPPAGWPENMQPSAVNNSARAMMGAVRRWYDTITAQLASLTTSLGNYVLKTGDTMTGNLTVVDLSATNNIWASSGAVTASYLHSTGPIQADGTMSAAQLTSTGNITATSAITGAYVHSTGNIQADGAFTGGSISVTGDIHAASGSGSLYGTALYLSGSYALFNGNLSIAAGPLLNVSNTDWIHRLGPGAGRWWFEKSDGSIVASIDANGSIYAGANLFLTGDYILFHGNPSNAQGPYLTVNNTDWIARLGAGNGHYYFANAAGVAAASIAADGTISAPQLRGGNGASDAGVLRGMPTADPTPHTIAFGWDGISSVFYRNIDNSRTDTIPWSDTIRAFLLAADGGTPSGWRLGVYSGGTIFNIYVDFTVSDQRLKRGVADSEVDALAALCAVPVRRFEWVDEVQKTFGVPQGPVEIGLVAQDLLPHMPDCVGISEGRGDPFPDDTHTIMHDRLDGYYIRAIQQLAAQNAALAARVTALEEHAH